MATNSRQSTMSLIMVPAIIALAITILRLVGELQNWSPALFNKGAGGPGALIGISWLPFIFGIYFAVKLFKSGDAPSSPFKALGVAILGLVLIVIVVFALSKASVSAQFLGFFGIATIAAIIQFIGWPALARTNLAYAVASRIPVLIVMFLAIRGSWGTHYDAIGPELAKVATYPLMLKYLYLAILPQVFFWIPITVLVGALMGSITAVIMSFTAKKTTAAQTA